jgi:uncharacterized damage-inducible protein DinB
MTILERAIKRNNEMIRLSCATLGNIVQGLSRERATTLRDGPDGWTTLEVLCHLRDFEQIFYERLQTTLAEESPTFPTPDPDAMAIELRYNEQDLQAVYADFQAARERFIAAAGALSEEQLARSFIHPLRGPETIADIALNIARHDLVHLEQITRILR